MADHKEGSNLLARGFDLVATGKATPIQIERMFNSAARLDAGVPTGAETVSHDAEAVQPH